MPGPALPLLGAAAGAGLRFLGAQIGKRATTEALKQQAIKQGAVGASGMGLFSASPAQAPTAPNDTARVSPEASKPEAAPAQVPDFGASFGP